MTSKSAERFLAGAMTIASAVAFGQTGSRPHFEVASVKPSSADIRSRWTFPPGKASLMHIDLKDAITMAYGFPPFLVSGEPAWSGTDYYDIVGELAVQESAPPARQQLLDALQVLLEDRFQLRIRRESKNLPLYKLTVAKGGFRLKEGDELPEGIPGGGSTRTTIRLLRKKVPISNLITALSWELGCHVEDLTGLQGLYSFVLEWNRGEPLQTPASPGDAQPPAGESGFAMLAALRSQLGLNLERGKGPVEVLVVDSAQKAGEN